MFAAESFYQPVSCLWNFGNLTPFFDFIQSLSFSGQTVRVSAGVTLTCLLGFPMYVTGFTPLDKGFLYRSFLYDFVPALVFCEKIHD